MSDYWCHRRNMLSDGRLLVSQRICLMELKVLKSEVIKEKHIHNKVYKTFVRQIFLTRCATISFQRTHPYSVISSSSLQSIGEQLF